MSSKKVAVVRICGQTRLNEKVKRTLTLLNLHRKFSCAVFDNTPSVMGMLKRIETFITYGEISDEVYKTLVEKRGQKTKDGLKPFFRLSPPLKGFERKGTKHPFAMGGACGNRGDKMDALLKRMI